MNNKQTIKNNYCVSEIVGAILLLMIVIAIISILYLTAPQEIFKVFPSERNNTDVIGFASCDEVVLKHAGGSSWPSYVVTCSNGYKVTGATFQIGNQIQIPLTEETNIMLTDNYGDIQFSGTFRPCEIEQPDPEPEPENETVETNGMVSFPTDGGYNNIKTNDEDVSYFYTKDHYDFYDFTVNYNNINTTGTINVTVTLRNTYDWNESEWIVKVFTNGTEFSTVWMTGLTTTYETYYFEFPTTVLKDVKLKVFVNAKMFRNQIRVTEAVLEVN